MMHQPSCSRVLKGLISLGGGLPSSDYFPFERLDIKAPKPPSVFDADIEEAGIVATAGKHDVAEGKSIYGIIPICLEEEASRLK